MRAFSKSLVGESESVDGIAIVDQPRSGVDNMAIDQAMLAAVAAGCIPLLRIYRWAAPTVSLGYFQKYSEFEAASCFAADQHVRRSTGGGAIVHHYDWTYSLAVPESLIGNKIGASSEVYDALHEAVAAWLQRLGWDAMLWEKGTTGPSGNPFLCFSRRSTGDVVVGDAKVMGSAQRRMQGGVLQHGSLLLARSPCTPELAGLAELSTAQDQVSEYGTALRDTKFEEAWQLLPVLVDASETLGLRFSETNWGEFENAIGDWRTAKFGSEDWLRRV